MVIKEIVLGALITQVACQAFGDVGLMAVGTHHVAQTGSLHPVCVAVTTIGLALGALLDTCTYAVGLTPAISCG